MHHLVRPLLAAAATLLAGALLAGCTITSDKPLVADTEAVAPLPDAFTFFPYEAGNGGFVRSSDAPASFVHNSAHYVARDLPDGGGALDVEFLPLGEEAYLLAATDDSSHAMTYGFARYANGVLSIALSPDKDTAAAIARQRTGAMPQTRKALAGLSISTETGAITIKSRAALDTLGRMYVDGKLPMDALVVGYVALDPDAAPPTRLIPNGRQWMSVP